MSRLPLMMLLAACSCLLGQEPVVSTNLLPNRFLREGIYGPAYWDLNRPGDNRVEWYAAAGADEYALLLTGSGDDWAGASSGRVAVTAGEKLTVAAWIRSDAAADDRDRLFVRFFGDTGFLGQVGPAIPTAARAWRLLTETVTVPDGASQADVSLQIRSPGAVWLHSAALCRGEALPPGTLPEPSATEFTPIAVPRGKPADADHNGLPDSLERFLGITAADAARSARLTRRKTTSFQTPTGYREDNDLKVDVVIVAGNNAHDIRSWQDFGYETHCMGGFRDGPAYVAQNPGEPQTDAAGTQLTCGPGSYYLVPTAQRRRIMADYFAQAVRNGAQAACPEEPEFFSGAGYSEAFKQEWQALYGEPWQDPASSVDARLKAERLKAHLEQQLLTDIYGAAREVDPQVQRFLLAHSPLNYSAWGIVFAHCSMLRTGLVDQFVAQVWTGTARSHVTHQGVPAQRTFENAFLEYSSSWNLVRGLDIPVWFLMDPVEDDPGRTMEDYLDNYERTLAASLLFPEVDRFEVMPWPTRIFGRVPDEFATEITGVIRALSDMQDQGDVEWDCGTQGIATFIADSAMYQRGAPEPSDMNDLYGLCLPLLMQGIPVQIAHLDRITDPGYLEPYHTLLVSYDALKPESAAANEALARWVAEGGSLLVFGGEDAYCDADAWWHEKGFFGPTDHLLSLLGFDVSDRRMASAEEHPWQTVAETDYAGRELANRSVVEIDLSPFLRESDAVYVRFEDTLKADGWGPSILGLEFEGARDGAPVKQAVVPGTEAEAALIYDDHNSGYHADPPVRFTDRDTYIVYRLPFDRGTAAALRVDVGNQYRIQASAQAPERTRAFREGQWRAPDLWELPIRQSYVTYDASGAEGLVTDGESALVLAKRHGKGRVLFCGLPGRHFAGSEVGDRQLRALVRRLVDASDGRYIERPYLKLRRGDYVTAKTFEQPLRIEGTYVHLLEPDLPIVSDPTLEPDRVAVLRMVRLQGPPAVLFCSSCIEWQSEEGNRTRLVLSDALGVQGALRLRTGGRAIGGVRAASASGEDVHIQVRQGEDGTVLLCYDNRPTGIAVDIAWQ